MRVYSGQVKQTQITGTSRTSRPSNVTFTPIRADHRPSAAATRSCGQPGKC
jgi:hypothetical protein